MGSLSRPKREVSDGTKIDLFEFGVKHLNFGATYLSLGAIYLNFGNMHLNFGNFKRWAFRFLTNTNGGEGWGQISGAGRFSRTNREVFGCTKIHVF